MSALDQLLKQQYQDAQAALQPKANRPKAQAQPQASRSDEASVAATEPAPATMPASADGSESTTDVEASPQPLAAPDGTLNAGSDANSTAEPVTESVAEPTVGLTAETAAQTAAETVAEPVTDVTPVPDSVLAPAPEPEATQTNPLPNAAEPIAVGGMPLDTMAIDTSIVDAEAMATLNGEVVGDSAQSVEETRAAEVAAVDVPATPPTSIQPQVDVNVAAESDQELPAQPATVAHVASLVRAIEEAVGADLLSAVNQAAQQPHVTKEPIVAPTEQPSATASPVAAPQVEQAQAAVTQAAAENAAMPEPVALESETEPSVIEQPVTEQVSDPLAVEPPVAEQPVTEARDWKPAWEVDQFLWPDVCAEIEQRLGAELVSTVAKLRRDNQARQNNTIVMTSPQPGCGRTTMTLSLAREFARQGMTVAVLDCDHAQPELVDQLGVGMEHGLERVLENQLPLADACICAVEDNVTLVASLTPVAAEQFAGLPMATVLRDVMTRFDVVLIDASPEAARVLRSHLPDGKTVLVSDQRTIAVLDADTVQQTVGQQDGAVGVIENFAA